MAKLRELKIKFWNGAIQKSGNVKIRHFSTLPIGCNELLILGVLLHPGICSIARPGSSKLPSKNALLNHCCPPTWKFYKVWGLNDPHTPLYFVPVYVLHSGNQQKLGLFLPLWTTITRSGISLFVRSSWFFLGHPHQKNDYSAVGYRLLRHSIRNFERLQDLPYFLGSVIASCSLSFCTWNHHYLSPM